MSALHELAAAFENRVDKLHACCRRVELQRGSNRLSVTDVELVYTSSFLAMCCSWEGFLESSLFEVVCGPKSKKSGRVRHVDFRSRKHFRGVLLHPNKDYVGLESLGKAIAVSKLYVQDGRPFSDVSESNRTYLDHASRIRNAVAHQSDTAMVKFRQGVQGVDSLPGNRRTPGTFLRHVFRRSPDQTRLSLYATALKASAAEISAAW